MKDPMSPLGPGPGRHSYTIEDDVHAQLFREFDDLDAGLAELRRLESMTPDELEQEIGTTPCVDKCGHRLLTLVDEMGTEVARAREDSVRPYDLSEKVSPAQFALCARFDVSPLPALSSLKVGVARGVRHSDLPIHGLRHPPAGDTAGWYLWTGEYSDAPDFFEPVHIRHLGEWCPRVMRYLALPTGWRFLIGAGHEDVWFDPTLLEPWEPSV